jgi:hypothetical protein
VPVRRTARPSTTIVEPGLVRISSAPASVIVSGLTLEPASAANVTSIQPRPSSSLRSITSAWPGSVMSAVATASVKLSTSARLVTPFESEKEPATNVTL